MSPVRLTATVTAVAALALALDACGGARPHPRIATVPGARAVAQANATHEYPAPAPPAQRAPGAAGPEQAVAAFARMYINWNAGDVSATLSRLAQMSIGQARSEMSLAAAETRVDRALRQGEISNRGSVEAVAPLAGHRDRYVVVTREATASAASGAYQGLAPAWHVTLASVAQIGAPGTRRWVLSGWQPES